VSAAHQSALRGHVELRFGEKFTGRLAGGHGLRIEQGVEEV
jgi:hypothetical protein